MLLETEEVRQFYVEKAEADPLLQGIMAGKKTFTGCLEDCITDLKEKGWVSHARENETTPLQDFSTLVTALSGLSEGELEQKPFNTTAQHMAKYRDSKWLAPFAAGYLALTTLGLILGPFVAVEVFFVAAGAFGTGATTPSFIKGWKARRNPEKAFGRLYGAAQHHDSLIGRCFVLEHFHNARPRFEKTYRSLSGDEREAVDEQLQNYLRAGGITGMDESGLNDYLNGVLASEPGGDA